MHSNVCCGSIAGVKVGPIPARSRHSRSLFIVSNPAVIEAITAIVDVTWSKNERVFQ